MYGAPFLPDSSPPFGIVWPNAGGVEPVSVILPRVRRFELAVALTTRDPNAGRRHDSAAKNLLVLSLFFLVISSVLAAVMLVSIRFPGFTSPTSFGVLRPVTYTSAFLGWLVPSFLAGTYYVLPRLTGAPLWREDIAGLGGLALGGVTSAGLIVVALGLGDGIGPLSLPWWIDLPILVLLLIPVAVVTQTIRRRNETAVYVSLWYLMTGVLLLPVAYLIGNLPNLTAIGTAAESSFFTNAFLILWVVGMGSGLAYYTVPKTIDQPLASRSLARVGFWSLVLAAAWGGPAWLVHSPLPNWSESVAAVLGLAGLVAALATTANYALTASARWADRSEQPSLSAAWIGACFTVVVAGLMSVGGFPSAATLFGFTTYWEGVLFAATFGVGSLFTAAWAYQALPNLTGRAVYSNRLARRHIRLTIVGVGGTALFLGLAGLVSGYAATGAALSMGDEAPTSVLRSDVALGAAAFFGLVAMWAQLTLFTNLVRTVTSGRATLSEVLVTTEAKGSRPPPREGER